MKFQFKFHISANIKSCTSQGLGMALLTLYNMPCQNKLATCMVGYIILAGCKICWAWLGAVHFAHQAYSKYEINVYYDFVMAVITALCLYHNCKI